MTIFRERYDRVVILGVLYDPELLQAGAKSGGRQPEQLGGTRLTTDVPGGRSQCLQDMRPLDLLQCRKR